MQLEELIRRGRLVTHDLVVPYFTSDDDWRDWLNEAQEEAAIRGRLIEDEAIEVDVAAGEPLAEYPAYLWAVQRVFFGGRRLQLVDREMLDAGEGEQWESATGQPIACYEVSGKLRLYPIPNSSGTARVAGFCVPRHPMAAGSDEPGLPARAHLKLLNFALSQYYGRQDAETFDPNKAAQYAVAFEADFGPPVDEKAMRRKRINVRRFVAGAWF